MDEVEDEEEETDDEDDMEYGKKMKRCSRKKRTI